MNREMRIGLVVLVLVLLAGIGAPWLAPYDPIDQRDIAAGQLRPPGTVLQAIELDHGRWLLADRVERLDEGLRIERLGREEILPAEEVLNLTEDGVADSQMFILGSDRFGRDVLSRLIWGARISLLIATTSLSLSLVLGILIGALAALGGGFLDTILMRFVDGVLALPWILILVTLAAIFPTDTMTLILILGGTGWMSISRLVRGELLSLRERGYIQAARGLGVGPVRIFLHHLLPNMLTPIAVAATLRVASLILTEAALSFLGFGVRVPQPSWGNMIADGNISFHTAWWLRVFPGLALASTVVAVHLVSDGLRDVLDPRRR